MYFFRFNRSYDADFYILNATKPIIRMIFIRKIYLQRELATNAHTILHIKNPNNMTSFMFFRLIEAEFNKEFD